MNVQWICTLYFGPEADPGWPRLRPVTRGAGPRGLRTGRVQYQKNNLNNNPKTVTRKQAEVKPDNQSG